MPPQSTPFTEARTVENPILKWLRTPNHVSLMPEGLEAAMTESELADLVAYLASLKAKK